MTTFDLRASATPDTVNTLADLDNFVYSITDYCDANKIDYIVRYSHIRLRIGITIGNKADALMVKLKFGLTEIDFPAYLGVINGDRR